MKKTLIALMALAGVAMADNDAITLNTIDAVFTSAPVKVGNCYSGDYTFEFTLTEDYTLAASGSVLGFYRGSAINDTYGYNAFVLGGSDEALTLTIGRGRAENTVNNANGISADTTFNFQDNVTFTPTLSWTTAEGIQSEALASYDSNMNGYAALTCVVNTGTIKYVPEPATATLSLLALAGLAARRRRK